MLLQSSALVGFMEDTTQGAHLKVSYIWESNDVPLNAEISLAVPDFFEVFLEVPIGFSGFPKFI